MKSTETDTALFGRKPNSTLDLIAVRARKPVRIPKPETVAHPVLRGSKPYLRALRAAEMAVWNARINLPITMLLVTALGS
jgi:hypothetical protein